MLSFGFNLLGVYGIEYKIARESESEHPAQQKYY